jgi:YVTN family beta-propeller protein
VLALVVLSVVVASPVTAEGPPERPDTRQVMFVGNNWDGTADIIDSHTFERLGRINTIPDKDERLAEIHSDPERLAFYLAIRQAVGEGNDQYTDDMFTSHDGRFVYVSRPSFADVVGIDLRTHAIVWRFPMEGNRSDHMAVSPDGTSLLVSDSTANKVHRIDARTGQKTGEFPSGDSPHENNYSPDGKLIYHASIGRVYTPTDDPLLGLVRDTSKGQRYFQIVDGQSLQVLKRFDMGDKLAEFGRPDMESAVRPMAIAPGERYVYAQISFHHGFIEYDLEQDKVLRVADLPVSDKAQATPREQYLLDSAHHGLAINADGTKLCAAGTMSDYAAIVHRDDFSHKIFQIGEKPYWSTNGPAGQQCWVSSSGNDHVAVLDYRAEREVARVPVGDHPQRIRAGAIQRTFVAGLPAAPGGGTCPPPPRASISRTPMRNGRNGVSFTGRAVAFRCADGELTRGTIKRVDVGLARRDGNSCRWFGAKRRFGRRAPCGAPVYRRARLGRLREGKVPWTFRTGAGLPRGSYVVTVRAHDADGRITSAAGRRYVSKRFRIR